MQKKLIIITAALVLLISACSPKTPAAPPAATPSQPPPAASATPIAAECTVVSLMPTAGPTEVSLFPPASAEDWVRGPEDAAVTFLEYSDFQ